MHELKLSRGLLSAYYISLLFANLFFVLPFFQNLIVEMRGGVAKFIQTAAGETAAGWVSWFSLFLVCFLFVFLIKRYLVEPNGFYIGDESHLTRAELAAFLVLVLGALVYYVNYHFSEPMPEEIPEFIKNWVSAENADDKSNIVPFLWNLGPLIFMLLTYRNRASKPSEKKE